MIPSFRETSSTRAFRWSGGTFSQAIPTTLSRLGPYFFWSSIRCGIASTQGAHQVPQKSRRTIIGVEVLEPDGLAFEVGQAKFVDLAATSDHS